MGALKHILIPLDGSSMARKVLPYVAKLYATQALQLTFLRVIEASAKPTATLYSLPNWAGVMRELAKADKPEKHPVYENPLWEAFQDELTVQLEPNLRLIRDSGFCVELVLRYGDPVEQVKAHLEQSEVDLLVMATRAHSGLSRVLFGSVADALLRTTTIPIMMLRPELITDFKKGKAPPKSEAKKGPPYEKERGYTP